MAHDEGPLTIKEGGPEHDYAIIDVEHGYILGEAYRHVGAGVFKDAEANAHLWAVASKLLAACEAAQRFIAQLDLDRILLIRSGLESDSDIMVLRELSAAIAQARGAGK